LQDDFYDFVNIFILKDYNSLCRENPAQTAPNPRVIWSIRFVRATANCPFLAIVNISYPKAEKVVNPPRNPMRINARTSDVNIALVSERPPRKPIKRHPAILTSIVPYGKNGSLNILLDNSLVRCRQIEPVNPPIPIINILTIYIYPHKIYYSYLIDNLSDNNMDSLYNCKGKKIITRIIK